MKTIYQIALVAIFFALSACTKSSENNDDVQSGAKQLEQIEAIETMPLVVYSSRKEQLVEPLFSAFTEETGIPIKFVTDKAEPLIQKLKAEGEQTPADIFMTVDAGNLSRAAAADLLQALDSDKLEAVVPSHLQDPNKQWFGLSQRARTIVYAKDRVNPENLTSYEALGDEQWQGRLCLRTAKKVYNQSLVAMMIAQHGVEKTEDIVASWVKNLATEPFSNDTKAMEAVVAGQCDLTVVNTYYLGRLLRDNPDLPLAIFWPNQTTDDLSDQLSGVHVNISGAGITRYAKNPSAAKQFLEWLVSEKAQSLLANGNLEYPVSNSVELDPIVAAWGEFKSDQQDIAKAGELQPEAVRLMDRVAYY